VADDVFQRSMTLRRSRAFKAAMLSPAVILFASATRLLFISNYDTTTATTIASAAGIVGTLLGTVIPLLPPYLPVLTILLAAARRWTLAGFAGCAAVLLSPTYVDSASGGFKMALNSGKNALRLADRHDWFDLWKDFPSAVIFAILGALLVVLVPPTSIALSLSNSVSDFLVRFVSRVIYCIIVGLLCASIALLVKTFYQVPFSVDLVSEIARRPWIPAEEISLKSDAVPRVGYTLSTSDKWQIVLNESDRSIIYLRADDVVARTTCKPLSTYIEQPKLPLFPLRHVQLKPVKTCMTTHPDKPFHHSI
jgi:hypothetical protein